MGAVLSRVLGGIGRVLIFAGVVLLLFVGYQLWGTALDERGHQADLTQEFGDELGDELGIDEAKAKDTAALAKQIIGALAKQEPRTAPPLETPAEGEPVGFIEIPKIDLEAKSFVEGVSKADLRKGPGHYPGTPFPGNAGNAGIAGHRTTYGAPFNRIDELVPGDDIVVYTAQGRFIYEVTESPESRRSGPENEHWGQGWYAVRPSDVSVLDQTGENMITLTACHPKRSARYRIIVHARLVAEPAPSPVATLDADGTPANSETVGLDPAEAADAEADAIEEEPTGSATSEADLIGGDPDELRPALGWFALVAGIWVGSMALAAFIRRRRTRAWWVYPFTVALSAYPLWLSFLHMDRFLPSF